MLVYTMVRIVVFITIFSEWIFQTQGRLTFQPYGPKMCYLYCQRDDCFNYEFDEVQLFCQLNIKALVLKNTSNGEHKEMSDDAGITSEAKRKTPSSRHPDNKTIRQQKSLIERDFLEACEDDNLKDVKRYVELGMVDINCRNDMVETCVMNAAMEKDKDMFDFLVQRGCDLSAVDEDNSTVLHFACFGGSIYIVKKLVDDHKLDIHWRDNDGKTPVLYTPNRQVVEFLKERGADLKTIDEENNNILHVAAKKGHVDVALYVLSLNIIDVESRGRNGRTPLMMAIKNGRFLLVDVLHKQHRASLTLSDDYGFNALHLACDYGHLDMVKHLVTLPELRGYERRKDDFGNTPAELAKEKGLNHIVSYLNSLKN